MTKKQKRILIRIIITAVIFTALMAMKITGVFGALFFEPLELILFVIPYLLVGYDVLLKAIKNILKGQVFDENFLMTIATVAALCIKEYPEAVAVMLLYQIGELFQSYAVGKSRQSISKLMDIMPEYANLETDGILKEVDPDDVEIDNIIVIKPGEKIPLDSVVTLGESFIDTAPLTGEAVPKKVGVGSELISGCINGEGTLKAKVTKEFENSTVSRILELVENAESKKAKVENFITRFARVYTPIVTICALILALIPPIFLGDFSEWIKRGCIFLVISCPCALVISVPLGFFGGIGAASKIGVLIKGGNYLEALSDTDTFVFDKTGTLTKGEFKVSEVIPQNTDKDSLLALAALAEGFSNHPIASSIKKAYSKPVDTSKITSFEELTGLGVHAEIDGKDIYLGNAKLMKSKGIDFEESANYGTAVYIAQNDAFLGTVIISDALKENAISAVKDLCTLGTKDLIMLTGDRQKAAKEVADKLNIKKVYSELLPQDKLSIVDTLIKESTGKKVAFAGDGINDAPVLALSDVGIAMGSMGSDAAIEAADIVIMDDDLTKIPVAVKLAKKVMRIVKENIAFALLVKFMVMILGVLGLANMWLAVFADVGVAILAILNSMRTLKLTKD